MMVKLKSSLLVLAVLSLVFLLAWFFFVSPYVLRFSEVELRDWTNTGTQKIYDSDTNNYSETFQSVILKDSVVSSNDGVFEISSSSTGMDRYNKEVYWNASTSYAFNRYSRRNVDRASGVESASYFAFPPKTLKSDYLFSSPEVLEKEGIVKFNGEVEYKKYKVYNFSYSLENLDKTQFFPLILSGQKIIGDHRGSMLVEPKTGVVLYFEHSGINKLHDSSGKYITDYEIWSSSFNEFTANNQLILADNLQSRYSLNQSGILILSIILALSLLLYLYFVIRDNLLD